MLGHVPVMSGTKKNVTRMPVTPQIAAIMKVQLNTMSVSESSSQNIFEQSSLLSQVVLNGCESLRAHSSASFPDSSGETVTSSSVSFAHMRLKMLGKCL